MQAPCIHVRYWVLYIVHLSASTFTSRPVSRFARLYATLLLYKIRMEKPGWRVFLLFKGRDARSTSFHLALGQVITMAASGLWHLLNPNVFTPEIKILFIFFMTRTLCIYQISLTLLSSKLENSLPGCWSVCVCPTIEIEKSSERIVGWNG